jgi:transcriptional regulator with XRE-family HTH domain
VNFYGAAAATSETNEGVPAMPVLRQVVGETLRALRMRQRRTLREVSSSARVSLGYLSEVERGQKEPSSELLAAIAGALDVELSDLFAEVAIVLRREEKLAGTHLAAVPAAGAAPRTPASGSATAQLRAVPTVAA